MSRVRQDESESARLGGGCDVMLCSALASWRQPAVSCPAGESWPTGLSVRRAAPELVCRPVYSSLAENTSLAAATCIWSLLTTHGAVGTCLCTYKLQFDICQFDIADLSPSCLPVAPPHRVPCALERSRSDIW